MDPSLPAGTIVDGRWRITGLLGEGGFGRVFQVEDVSDIGLGAAALKVLHPNTSPQERESFLVEARKIAQLRHQNLVGYLDSGRLTIDGPGGAGGGGEIRPYLVTELCERSLSDHVGATPGLRLGTPEVLAVLADVVAGLEHLHQRGLIHRDIKPANVLYADGSWKLADFGLMRDLSATGSYHRGDLLMGTPVYMAPELFSTMTATAASDVYALGVLTHLIATGRPLHAGAGPALVHNITSTAPSIDQSLDPILVNIVARATAPDPAARPTADQLQGLIRSGASAPAPRFTPPRPASAPYPADGLADQATMASGPPMGHGQTPAPSSAPPVPQARRTGLLLAAVGIVVAVGLVPLMVLALGGGDDSTDPTPDPLALTDDVDRADGSDRDTAGDDDQRADLGEGVEVGEGVEIGDRALIGGGAVPDAETHFSAPPCAGPDPVNLVRVVNQHEVAADYRVTLHHFDDAGVRIGESFDTILALPPGQEALLGLGSAEEGAARCEVAALEVTESDPAALAAIGQAEITECVLDEFFGNWYDIVFTVTNDQDRAVDAEVAFAVVDANGLRIDESFTHSIYGIQPGETVRGEGSEVFWNMDDATEEVDRCVVTWVELEHAR